MSRVMDIQLEMPEDPARFQLSAGVNDRLHELLDCRDQGKAVSAHERREAQGLVNLAALLTLLRLRTERIGRAEESSMTRGLKKGAK